MRFGCWRCAENVHGVSCVVLWRGVTCCAVLWRGVELVLANPETPIGIDASGFVRRDVSCSRVRWSAVLCCGVEWRDAVLANPETPIGIGASGFVRMVCCGVTWGNVRCGVVVCGGVEWGVVMSPPPCERRNLVRYATIFRLSCQSSASSANRPLFPPFCGRN